MIKKTSTNITYCNPNDKSFIVVTEPILINNNNNLEGNLNNNHSTRNRIRYNYTTNNLNNNLNLENEVLNDDINLISNLNIVYTGLSNDASPPPSSNLKTSLTVAGLVHTKVVPHMATVTKATK